MRDIKNKLTSGKNTKNIKPRRGKMFGYQVLGFGAGGVAPLFITATGGTVVTVGDFKVHRFNGNGCFEVTCAGNAGGSNSVDYMVVAGGGGGGGYPGNGGAGAGGMRLGAVCAQPSIPTRAPGYSVTATTYPIVIGAGGTPGKYSQSPRNGGQGGNSSGLGFTAAGGGYGVQGCGNKPGANGGSGSGGTMNCASPGGSGNTPPVSPVQGHNGGTGAPASSNCTGGGGGGGSKLAGGTGYNSGPANPAPGGSAAGSGGNGVNVSPIFGCAPKGFYNGNNGCSGSSADGIFAGGAGGSVYWGNPAPGGQGGGANGAVNSEGAGKSGTENSGGGGAGTSALPAAAGAGGSGVVLIRYKFQ